MSFLKLTTAVLLSVFLLVKADPNPIPQDTRIALSAQRIDSLDKSIDELRPLVASVASLKQTVDTDHQLLMGIGAAMIINLLSGFAGKVRRGDAVEPPERARSHAAGGD